MGPSIWGQWPLHACCHVVDDHCRRILQYYKRRSKYFRPSFFIVQTHEKNSFLVRSLSKSDIWVNVWTPRCQCQRGLRGVKTFELSERIAPQIRRYIKKWPFFRTHPGVLALIQRHFNYSYDKCFQKLFGVLNSLVLCF